MKRTSTLGAVVACLIAPVAFSTAAHADADFYKGKTVNIVIGAKGGSLTVAAELVGRHFGRHIPGNPTVINTQMPGGAHQIATNHVFNVAKPDGLTLLAANPSVGVAQLAKARTVRFDVSKFEWLGSSGSDGVLFAIDAKLPYKTFEEMQKAGAEIVAGTTGPGSNAHDFPLLLKEFAGANLKLVPGYPANSDILLAIERGEVGAWSALGTTILRGVDRGSVRALVRGRTPIPGYEHLPVDEDLATSKIGKALMAIRGIPLSIGRAFAAPPGTPADRVAMLREAFNKTMEDPKLLEEAKKAGIRISLVKADEVAENFKTLLDQPPEVLEAMNKYLGSAR
jgi:tripartite-type tricarboxylate transporter receptor subunit TctC